MYPTEQFIRISDLANYPYQPESIHIYKAGINKGKTKRIRERPASKGLIGVSEMTIWRWIKRGSFPPPIKIGNVTVWRASEVYVWMHAQDAEVSA